MKTIFYSLIAVFLSAYYPVSAQAGKDVADQIVELEKAFASAIKSRDVQKAKQLQANGYFLAVAVQGMPLQIVPQERWLATLKEYITESFSIDHIKVDVYGSTAIASMLYTQKATVRGQDRSAQFFITDIWIKEKDGWKITQRNSSRPESASNTRPN